jgi:hypothetical protein
MRLDLPQDLVGLLQDMGYNWPEADEEKLFDLGRTWLEFAPKLSPAADLADAAAKRVWAENTGDAVDAFKAKWTHPDSGLAALRDSVSGTQMVGPLLMVAAAVVLALKINVIVQLTLLAIDIAEAIAGAPETGGASLLQIPVVKEITGRLVNILISLALEQILG